MKIDLEYYLARIKELLQDKLPSKLTEIDSEKNDGLVLPQIENDAYFFQGYHERMVNYSDFIIYGIDEIQSNSVNAMNNKTYTFFVEIAFTDRGENDVNLKKMMRYGRALEEIFLENYAKILGNTRFNIQLLEPITFESKESGVFLNSIGVKVTATLA